MAYFKSLSRFYWDPFDLQPWLCPYQYDLDYTALSNIFARFFQNFQKLSNIIVAFQQTSKCSALLISGENYSHIAQCTVYIKYWLSKHFLNLFILSALYKIFGYTVLCGSFFFKCFMWELCQIQTMWDLAFLYDKINIWN